MCNTEQPKTKILIALHQRTECTYPDKIDEYDACIRNHLPCLYILIYGIYMKNIHDMTVSSNANSNCDKNQTQQEVTQII